MTTVLLVFHIFITLSLVGLVLLQKNEGGGLGMGSSTMGGLMSARGTANLLTHLTAIFATLFFLSTLGLALVFKGAHRSSSLLDTPSQTVPVASVSKPEKAQGKIEETQKKETALPASPQKKPL